MNIDFRKLTYKEFYNYLDKIVLNAFGIAADTKTDKELCIKLKWYCSFISFFIKRYKIIRLNDFEKTVMNNKYYVQDADITIKLYDTIRLCLLSNYAFIDILDIRNFCDKVVAEIKF